MSLFKNTVTVGVFTFISRVFGYARDAVVASLLGASVLNDVFIIAFRLPNLFRTIFGEGAMSVSFIPKFNEIKTRNKQKSKRFASSVQAILLLCLLVLMFVFMLFMPKVITFLAPGYVGDVNTFDLIVSISRITFPYILLISLAAFYGGILSSHGKFFPFAAAPVILNIVLIIACMFAYNSPNPVYVLSYAVIVAGILEFLFVLYFAFKIGFILEFKKPKIDDDIKIMFRRFMPGLMSSGVLQVNVLVSTILASFYVGGNSYIYYADRIYMLPVALIGAALGTVVLPSLSKLYAENREKDAKKLIENACFLGLFFSVPSMVGIAYLAQDIIEALFQHGEFGANDTINTAKVLFLFVMGVPGYILYKIFSACFFASGNTKFPFKTSVISTFVNVTIALSFFGSLGILAIPTGAIISLYLSVFILLLRLLKNKAFYITAKMKVNTMKILISAMLMLLGLMSFEYLTSKANSVLEIILEVSIGGTLYLGSAIMLKLVKKEDVFQTLKFKNSSA